MNELALFAGGGGGILGGKLLGWRTRCAVETNPYARSILLSRQRDGMLERFPIWDDVKTFDGTRWAGTIDVVSGGFPCQDISPMGKQRGLAGERSGLWFEMLRIVDEVRPPFVFAENSPRLRANGLGTIIKGLAELGYGVRWCVLGARHIGANHRRDRMWIYAYSNSDQSRSRGIKWLPDGETQNRERLVYHRRERKDDAMANRVDRVRTIGNGQVPGVAALAWSILSGTPLAPSESGGDE